MASESDGGVVVGWSEATSGVRTQSNEREREEVSRALSTQTGEEEEAAPQVDVASDANARLGGVEVGRWRGWRDITFPRPLGFLPPHLSQRETQKGGGGLLHGTGGLFTRRHKRPLTL